MSNYTQILNDISNISRLLSKEQICSSTAPIEKALGKLYNINRQTDGIIGYSVEKLKFEISDIPRGTIPSNIKLMTLCLNIEIHEEVLEVNNICYPIRIDERLKYNFNLELEGLDDNAIPYYASWHLDFDRKDENEVDFIHPSFHLTFGGNYIKNKIQSGNDLGHLLLLLSPRIPYPPMDLVLGIDFILRNFFIRSSKVKNILDNRQYQLAVKNSQSRLWKPYILSLANHWCAFKCNTYQPLGGGITKEIMPYLV